MIDEWDTIDWRFDLDNPQLAAERTESDRGHARMWPLPPNFSTGANWAQWESPSHKPHPHLAEYLKNQKQMKNQEKNVIKRLNKFRHYKNIKSKQ